MWITGTAPGWKDPFSSQRFTDRQNGYVLQLHRNSAYTPQLVIDGRKELVGSDSAGAKVAIEEAIQRTKVSVIFLDGKREGNQIYIRIDVESAKPGPEIFAAIGTVGQQKISVTTKIESEGNTK